MKPVARRYVPAGWPAPLAAAVLALACALLVSRSGIAIGLEPLVALAAFLGCVLAFVAVPWLAVSGTIVGFALLPAVKLFATPWIGPAKDALVLAAVTATAIVLVAGRFESGQLAVARVANWPVGPRLDPWVAASGGLLLALYLIDAGGGHGIAWFHGVRLVSEPLALLAAGLLLDGPGRTLRWATATLVATACALAAIGLAQQALGGPALVHLGYHYGEQVRTIGGQLRSFGTLDDPFAYAAFLLFGLAAVVFAMRRSILAYASAGLIVAGVVVSYERTALLIGAGLLGLWLARVAPPALAAAVVAGAAVAAVATIVLASGASVTQTAASGPVEVTFNGRTAAWERALGSASALPLGRGVGAVGTAATRASFGIVRRAPSGRPRDQVLYAVDSSYLATVADVGLAGLACLLVLVGRLAMLGWRGARTGSTGGWLSCALLIVLLLDGASRSSLTGFPTAFVGFLLVGVALAASERN